MSSHVAAELEEHSNVQVVYADLELHHPTPIHPSIRATAKWLDDDEYLEAFSAALNQQELAPSSSPETYAPQGLVTEEASTYSTPPAPNPVSPSLWTRHELSLRAIEDAVPSPVEPPVRVQAREWPAPRDRAIYERQHEQHDVPISRDADLETQGPSAPEKKNSHITSKLKAFFTGGRSRSAAQRSPSLKDS
jgi:hypothetical protein